MTTFPARLALAAFTAAAAIAAAPLRAQGAHRPPTAAAVVQRAQEMVGDGDAAGGRALLDSLLGALSPDAPEIPAVLVARAAAAEEPADAARDYRRVVVEFSTAAAAPEAALRLAQIELQGGERDRALARLARLAAEQPAGSVRARASYLAAHTYLEANDAARGCAALADARAALGPADVEVRNQVEYYAPRCRDVAAASGAPAVPNEGAALAAAPPPTPAKGTTPATRTKVAAVKPAPAKSAPGAARAIYTVQVAAVAQRASATLLVKKLRASGYDARVEGAAPYRVRIGRYATRAAAEAVADRLRAHKTPALVVEAARR